MIFYEFVFNLQLNLAELQREKAKQEALEWKERYDVCQIQLNLSAELKNLSIQKLKQLQVCRLSVKNKYSNKIFIFTTVQIAQ